MARTWFPDAGAGATEEGLAMVNKQIRDMARGGMGGIELAYIADATKYSNEDARENGWGSENWKKIMKQILKTANGIKGGFKVDITITSHWPPAVNNLDPNDIGASVEASYAYKKISKDDIQNGKVDVPLPEEKTQDSFRGRPAKFIFEDKFISATIARVKEVKDSNIVLEFGTMRDVSGLTTKKTDSRNTNGFAGHAAGIPDREYCAAQNIDYQKNVIESFGPEPASNNFTGKIDADGNRRRMADWQYVYETNLQTLTSNLTASEGNKLAAGDYVIFGSYFRGTGQVMSGGASIPMYNRQYATDYFSEEGAQLLFKYWADHILDSEMIALLKKNAEINGTTSIFEDSIELNKQGASWAHDLLTEFKKFTGYDASRYVPALVVTTPRAEGFPGGIRGGAPGEAAGGSRGAGAGPEGMTGAPQGERGGTREMAGAPQGDRGGRQGMAGEQRGGAGVPEGVRGASGMRGATSSEVRETITFDDQAAVSKLKEDYNLVLGNLYSTEHADKIKKWATSFGYTYRAQGYPLQGLDVDQAALALDIPEGDNATAGDGVRQFASAINMAGKKMLSMESTTFSASINSRWAIVARRLNADFSDGINRSILHGSPFARTFNGYYSNWPGWNFGRYADMEDLHGWGFSAWNGRQIYWDDVSTITNYISRVQSVMQNGKAKVDLVVLIGTDAGFENLAGNSLRLLLNKGYSYNVMSEPVLKLPNAVVKDGTLAPDGPSYKALIIKDAKTLSVQAMKKVLSFAQNGLPVILYKSDISEIYGTDKPDNNSAALKELLADLHSGNYSNLATVTTDGELLNYLTKKGIAPAASYNQSKLESSHRSSAEGTYYFLYNDNGPSFNSGSPVVIPEPEVEGAGLNVNSDYSIKTTVSLEGDGIPYILDAWTGKIIPVAQYKKANGGVTLDINLQANDAVIVGIINNTAGFPDTGSKHVRGSSGGEVAFENSALVHRATTAGGYTITMPDNSKKLVQVESVPEPISISDGWDLHLQSFGPDEKNGNLEKINQDYSVDPTVSKKVDIYFKNIGLGNWNNLKVTSEQLNTLGLGSMDAVSGIGYYSSKFLLPEDWMSNFGAYLKLEHNEGDVIARLVINGNIIDNINQMTDMTDVAKFLKAGENSIEVKLDSTLQNRDPASVVKTTYGLTGVRLIPYCESEL